jgi:ATP-dependent DNA helicase RecG
MAREQFRIKNPGQINEMEQWDDSVFLNKAGITVHGAITNAALLLLGKPESVSLLVPAVAQISWILKDNNNFEMDYEHFGPPFLLQVNRVLGRIRNLTLRTLPSGTLFPQETTQYDLWVIREALHNSIAHQDYHMGGRINIVETPHTLTISNKGSFLPGTVENVIKQDSPPDMYRNPYLASAMVKLNMIDTQGGGIKRMFVTQMRRFFPLPDFVIDPERVSVTIHGEIQDEEYSHLLMERLDLDIWTIILLDKVQKRIRLPKEAHRQLKSLGFVEGRYPNLFIASRIARLTGQKARHILEKGFDKNYYMDIIIQLVTQHGPVSRTDIDQILINKLPDVLSEKQKKTKVHGLLVELAQKEIIRNIGGRRYPQWVTNPNRSYKKT